MRQWPDKFVYACNATQAVIVNALPIVHAGPERVDRVVIFCGVEQGREKDARERREAIEPAERLARWIESLGSPGGRRIAVELDKQWYGNPERVDVWAGYMRAVCADAAKQRLPVVYNLTGGRKLMSIGGLLGSIGQDARPVAVGGAPLRTEMIEDDKQEEMVRHGELSLDGYLTLYGAHETGRDRERRLDRQQFYRDNAAGIRSFAAKIAEQGIATVSYLERKTKPLEVDREVVAGSFEIVPNGGRIPAIVADALRGLGGMLGLAVSGRANGGLAVKADKAAARFLRGGWLEAAIYLAAIEVYRGRNDVEVAANVNLRFAGGTDASFRDIGELDVAVMIRSQLHVIEAKAGAFSSKASGYGEKSLEKVEMLKRWLQAQFGRSFVVNPRETDASLASAFGDFPTRAQNAGIELILGKNAISKIASRLAMLD